eukprot:1159801-Pelagomonas_calceolata.AAC.2
MHTPGRQHALKHPLLQAWTDAACWAVLLPLSRPPSKPSHFAAAAAVADSASLAAENGPGLGGAADSSVAAVSLYLKVGPWVPPPAPPPPPPPHPLGRA